MRKCKLLPLLLGSIAVLFECNSCGGPSYRQGEAKADVLSICHAIKMFRDDHGYYPMPTNRLETSDLCAVLKVLIGSTESVEEKLLNPGAVLYINIDYGRYSSEGYRDPWGSFYNLILYADPKRKVSIDGVQINDNVVVWTNGPNKKNEVGGGDDIVSWTHHCPPK